MTRRCQHSACTCNHEETDMVERNGAVYCSDFCVEMGATPGPSGSEQKNCGCGHPDCTRDASSPTPGY